MQRNLLSMKTVQLELVAVGETKVPLRNWAKSFSYRLCVYLLTGPPVASSFGHSQWASRPPEYCWCIFQRENRIVLLVGLMKKANNTTCDISAWLFLKRPTTRLSQLVVQADLMILFVQAKDKGKPFLTTRIFVFETKLLDVPQTLRRTMHTILMK